MRLIIYDLDGTLVDTLQDITNAANHMLQSLGLPGMAAQQVRRFVGRGIRELVRSCLNTDDAPRLDAALKTYRAFYAQHMLDHSRLYPGARDALEHFRGRQQAVVTNKPNPYSRQILEGLGVAGYFIEIIAGDGDYPKKPDPASVTALLRKAQADASASVLIGDSPVDVSTGRRAGLVTVALTHGLADEDELRQAGPDVLVNDFAQLLDVARRHEW